MTLRTPLRELLKLLLDSSEPVDLYELHDRYQLAAGEILRTVRLLERLRLIQVDADGYASLVKGAHDRVLELRKRIFLDGDRPWADADLQRSDPASPYLPNLSKIDRSFFYAKVAGAPGRV